MAHWLVMQPNKRFARFSSISDDFTHMDMTQAQAFEILSETLPMEDALIRIKSGYKDVPAKGPMTGTYGTRRWNHAVDRIAIVHGKDRVDEVVAIGHGEPSKDYITFEIFPVDEDTNLKQDFKQVMQILWQIAQDGEETGDETLYQEDFDTLRGICQSYSKKYLWLNR